MSTVWSDYVVDIISHTWFDDTVCLGLCIARLHYFQTKSVWIFPQIQTSTEGRCFSKSLSSPCVVKDSIR